MIIWKNVAFQVVHSKIKRQAVQLKKIKIVDLT